MNVELDLRYSEVEETLRNSVKSFLRAKCQVQAVTAMYDGDRSIVGSLWRDLVVDVGLAGILIPEEYGGAGATAREAAVVLEELGYFIAPVPFLTSAVVATTAIVNSDDRGLLSSMASGDITASLAVSFSSAEPPTGDITEAGGLTGRITSVAGALEADILLVPVRTSRGSELHAVPRTETGVRVTPVISFDMSRQIADIDLLNAPSTLVAGTKTAQLAVSRAMTVGAALLSSEQLGIATWCIRSAIEYLRERRQFGRVLASYQAIKHRLADLSVQETLARTAARYAAAAAAADFDLSIAVSLAQAYNSNVAVHAAEECVQLHGGIGMTWEYPVHLYLKRAKADQIAFGTPGWHRAQLARLVDLRTGA